MKPLFFTHRFYACSASHILHFGLFFSFLITDAMSMRCLADWPQFLGPTGKGITSVQGLPTEWSESKNVRWYCPLNGLAWSSPIVVGKHIYLTNAKPAAEGEGWRLTLACVESDSGKLIFEKDVFPLSPNSPEIHKKNSHASPTPVFFEGKLFLHFGHEGTACMDLQGNVLWINRDHKYAPTHGNGSSPLIVDRKVIVTCDGGDDPCTLALDCDKGKVVWRVPRGIDTERKFSFCTPTLIEVDGAQQIISAGSDIVQALSPSDGKVLWFAKYEGYSLTVRPLFHDGLVFLSTGFNRPVLLAIDPKGKGDVSQTHIRWQHKSNVPNTPSLVPYGTTIIMINDKGVATCIDSQSGKEVWQKRVGGNFSASPLLAGDLIYFQSEGGECVVFRLGERPTEVARNILPGRIFASFAVAGRDLVIRNEQGLYRLGD